MCHSRCTSRCAAVLDSPLLHIFFFLNHCVVSRLTYGRYYKWTDRSRNTVVHHAGNLIKIFIKNEMIQYPWVRSFTTQSDLEVPWSDKFPFGCKQFYSYIKKSLYRSFVHWNVRTRVTLYWDLQPDSWHYGTSVLPHDLLVLHKSRQLKNIWLSLQNTSQSLKKFKRTKRLIQRIECESISGYISYNTAGHGLSREYPRLQDSKQLTVLQ